MTRHKLQIVIELHDPGDCDGCAYYEDESYQCVLFDGTPTYGRLPKCRDMEAATKAADSATRQEVAAFYEAQRDAFWCYSCSRIGATNEYGECSACGSDVEIVSSAMAELMRRRNGLRG